jgi:hypothetical protein
MTFTDWSRVSWRKSSKSNGSGDCVEVAVVGETIGLRDSKDPAGPVLVCTHGAWQGFLRLVKDGAGTAGER